MKSASRLAPFGPELWTANGPNAMFFGFPYPTRMALARLSGGRLFVWSPIALSPDLKSEVEALGEPAFLVSPNKLHHLFLGEWKATYPKAKMFASPGLRRRRKDLAFDADLAGSTDPGWAGEIDQEMFAGSLTMTEVVFFHRASRSALFADLIQNLPRNFVPGWRGVLARLGGITEPNPSAPRDWRASFLHRRAARASLARILGWGVERVVIAHGVMAGEDGEAFVRRAFHWLGAAP